VAILKEQAVGLEQLTRGVLTAEVSLSRAYGSIHLDFRVVAPALGGYEYSLVTAEHTVEMYPVKVMPSWGSYPDQLECQSPEAFETALATIFRDPKTRRIIQSLLSQSKASE